MNLIFQPKYDHKKFNPIEIQKLKPENEIKDLLLLSEIKNYPIDFKKFRYKII
jgi:hypothetical protein